MALSHPGQGRFPAIPPPHLLHVIISTIPSGTVDPYLDPSLRLRSLPFWSGRENPEVSQFHCALPTSRASLGIVLPSTMALTVLSAVRSAPLCPLSLRHVLPRTYLYSCSTTTSVPFRTATLSNSDAQYLIL
ncbi:hypothetical protein BD309DRAFT_972021 [Dichomitus squalens]|nr:hypothetical protein BD309DRAFT_972021 [Dichomitus squalens]